MQHLICFGDTVAIEGSAETIEDMAEDVSLTIGTNDLCHIGERTKRLFGNIHIAVFADTILVFPNNSNIILTANQASSIYEKAKIVVIPTKTISEGYYALANLDPELPLDDLKAALEGAAASVTTGMISRAIRDTEIAATGDFVGFSGKELLSGSPSRPEALKALAEKLDAGQADIFIIFRGADVPEEEAEALKSAFEKEYPATEVILLEGGQPVYDYILLLC